MADKIYSTELTGSTTFSDDAPPAITTAGPVGLPLRQLPADELLQIPELPVEIRFLTNSIS